MAACLGRSATVVVSDRIGPGREHVRLPRTPQGRTCPRPRHLGSRTCPRPRRPGREHPWAATPSPVADPGRRHIRDPIIPSLCTTLGIVTPLSFTGVYTAVDNYIHVVIQVRAVLAPPGGPCHRCNPPWQPAGVGRVNRG